MVNVGIHSHFLLPLSKEVDNEFNHRSYGIYDDCACCLYPAGVCAEKRQWTTKGRGDSSSIHTGVGMASYLCVLPPCGGGQEVHRMD